MRRVNVEDREHTKCFIVQLPTYADDVTLPALRTHTCRATAANLLHAAEAGTDRETDGHRSFP